MSSSQTRGAEIRAHLSHPVVDSDGHWLEFGPVLRDYVRRVAGSKAVEGLDARDEMVAGVLRLSPEQRRDRRLAQEAWWAVPSRNTLDRATALSPRLLYQRLDEIGLDFTVLYPSAGIMYPQLADDEVRRSTCRAFNMYVADAFREFSDRLTPAAVIPMHTPGEAIEELEYAIKALGLKVGMMGSLIRRPVPALVHEGVPPHATVWLDVLGLDSEYDYDPLWAKCVELKVAPTFHSNGRGIGLRMSPSNFTYNHIGHFAAAGEGVCKALFMGGVTRRFATLKFAFLEGGAGWACQLYADLISHWKKRNARALEDVNPMNLERRLLRDLLERYEGEAFAEGVSQLGHGAAQRMNEAWTINPSALDDYSACGIETAEDIRELFTRNFYFGCEADDPINAWAFNAKVNPYGARLKTLFGSDIGHFDVPDMREVLVEAYRLVDDGLITPEDLSDFVFGNAVDFWTGMNPDFFRGTVIESAAKSWLAEHQATR